MLDTNNKRESELSQAAQSGSALSQNKKSQAASFIPPQAVAPSTPSPQQASQPNTQNPNEEKASVSLRWADSLLSNAFGEFVSDVHDNGAQLVYRWNNSFWEEVNEAEGRAMCAKWLAFSAKKVATASTTTDAWRFGAMRLHEAKRKPAPTNDFVIPCANAYLRVENDGSIRVVSPDKTLGLTHAVKASVKTPVGRTHTPQSVPDTSLLHRFLSSSLPDESVRAFVQEQCALSFIPKCFGIVGVWFGPPAAGKSTMRNIVASFHARPSTVSLHKLDDSFGLEQILGSTLIQVDEVETKKWCEATFKSLATGDPVTVNRKHKTPIASYRNRAMIIMTSNHSPFVTDNSGGVYRRMAPVHWNVSIPEEERIPDIANQIFEQEADIFLDWILEGVQRVMKRGRFMPEAEWPKVVRDVKDTIRYSNDHVGAWMKDRTVVPSSSRMMTKKEVYDDFALWAQEEGRTQLDSGVFWRELARRPGFESVTKRTQGRIDGERVSVAYIDIRAPMLEAQDNDFSDLIPE